MSFCSGLPLVIISNEKRSEYINTIEQALLHDKKDSFYEIVYAAIEESLDSYIEAAKEIIKR